MKKRNAILFCNVDREDLYISGGLVFKVQYTEDYEGAYNEIKHKLETPEMIKHIIEDRCLLDDLFDDDETYKFKRTYWGDYRLNFEFENSEGNIVEYNFSAEFVLIIE